MKTKERGGTGDYHSRSLCIFINDVNMIADTEMDFPNRAQINKKVKAIN
jgi:hypothetical protein